MQNVFSDPTVVLATAVLLFIIALLLFILLYSELKRRPGMDVYAPYARQAVVAVFRLSEASADAFGKRLSGADKARLAASLYDHLPPPIQGQITPSQWEVMVEAAYTELVSLYERNKAALVAEFHAQVGEGEE